MISIFISYVDLGINQLGAVYEGLMSYTGFFAADDLSKPSKRQLDLLVELTRRAEVLWGLALRRLQIAEAESRRGIPVWGHEAERHGSKVAREQIEASLADPDGAYRRLRLIMDAWCALWFWPLHCPRAGRTVRPGPTPGATVQLTAEPEGPRRVQGAGMALQAR